MISIERIRNNYEVLKSSLALKGYNDDLNEIILIDREYRESLSLVNELRAERNKVTDQIAELKKSKQDAKDKIVSMRDVGSKIKDLESKISEKKQKLDKLILNLPNIPHESVPPGSNESQNKISSIGPKESKIFVTDPINIEKGIQHEWFIKIEEIDDEEELSDNLLSIYAFIPPES